jgi:hypothetical protein
MSNSGACPARPSPRVASARRSAPTSVGASVAPSPDVVSAWSAKGNQARDPLPEVRFAMNRSRLGAAIGAAGGRHALYHVTSPPRTGPDEPETPTKMNNLAIRRVDLHVQTLLPATSIGPLRPPRPARRRADSHGHMDLETNG